MPAQLVGKIFMKKWRVGMASKSMSAKYGHIKRRLSQGEPLTGKTLKTALEVLECDGNGSSDNMIDTIREKIVKGESLTEYEYHIFVEVILVHAKLSEDDV
jgi:hypothetical protein